ncbi:Cloroperoxidase [Aspergillus pseudoustus]|uniref:Cloroperoxidase n=1 Tax=Aspergillus pseudoustus TaxID=1810923 RepID=A0ABR4JUM3_9EURO
MINYLMTGFEIVKRLVKEIIRLASVALVALQLRARDLVYTLINVSIRRRRLGSVIPPGYPGHGREWPKYLAPNFESDSRSPCPGLNALANHGILPRNGKHLTYRQMAHAIQHAYNLSPTLAERLTAASRELDQGRGWIDLHDLNALNVIQHDASFTRPDIAFCPDQSSPNTELVDKFLAHASNGHSLSLVDLAYYSGLRRVESKCSNGEHSLSYSFKHKYFGSGNCALMYAVFGGDVNDLKVWLGEERFPDRWEPKNREALGYTVVQSQATTLAIEFNIHEDQALRPEDESYFEGDVEG